MFISSRGAIKLAEAMKILQTTCRTIQIRIFFYHWPHLGYVFTPSGIPCRKFTSGPSDGRDHVFGHAHRKVWHRTVTYVDVAAPTNMEGQARSPVG